MRLGMSICVRNEIDIIETNIRYHLYQGVDFIVVTDHLSSDGTGKLLKQLSRYLPVYVIEEREPTYFQDDFVDRMIKILVTEFNVDWIINSDADEFWTEKTNNIKGFLSSVSSDVNSIRVNWANAIIDPREAFNPNRKFYENVYIKRTSFPDSFLPASSKVIHRAVGYKRISMGNHSVSMSSAAEIMTRRLEIVHYSNRSLSEYIKKSTIGAESVKSLPSGYDTNFGKHWRDLADNSAKSPIQDLYLKSIMDQSVFLKSISDASIVPETNVSAIISRNFSEFPYNINENLISLIDSDIHKLSSKLLGYATGPVICLNFLSNKSIFSEHNSVIEMKVDGNEIMNFERGYDCLIAIIDGNMPYQKLLFDTCSKYHKVFNGRVFHAVLTLRGTQESLWLECLRERCSHETGTVTSVIGEVFKYEIFDNLYESVDMQDSSFLSYSDNLSRLLLGNTKYMGSSEDSVDGVTYSPTARRLRFVVPHNFPYLRIDPSDEASLEFSISEFTVHTSSQSNLFDLKSTAKFYNLEPVLRGSEDRFICFGADPQIVIDLSNIFEDQGYIITFKFSASSSTLIRLYYSQDGSFSQSRCVHQAFDP